MKLPLIAAVAVGVIALSGCQTTQLQAKLNSFFGTADKCDQAAMAYSAYLVVASSSDKISAKTQKNVRIAYGAVKGACEAGSDLTQANLAQLVAAFAAAKAESKQ